MYRMDKITTGVSYGFAGANGPSQWAALGVLASILFGLLTYLTNLYFKIKEDRRKAARGE
ncbi:MAG: class II holin family protein [Enterobacteriaceae bacterium]|nr:class II holin family protein [Enterobacteriaceae bacterium]